MLTEAILPRIASIDLVFFFIPVFKLLYRELDICFLNIFHGALITFDKNILTQFMLMNLF
jgi:hypothetical protein